MVSLTKEFRRDEGPAWEVARLYPNQGQWSWADYLALSRGTNRLVEYADGRIEVLEMPTKTHQLIVLYLYNLLAGFVRPGRLAQVLVAPYPVRLWEEKYREPDIVLMLAENAGRLGEEFAEGADLVVEVLSENRSRDLEVKRGEYARAGIPEYWVVDPAERRVTVLQLDRLEYAVFSEAQGSGRVDSKLLPGFGVELEAFWVAGEGK
jgi:Uma2 family endonuclease